ncbi:uncharacterized protein LOC120289722 [Eucalyptus grandis]|uniref:uncharacterized protein LOC120289722 n=1 Tax=Eucalyptus grandis TaxID=71139 RepID=UPI00192E86D9|nr:uncharacterized protein LOC120289722 [Eucalyptus grandis]
METSNGAKEEQAIFYPVNVDGVARSIAVEYEWKPVECLKCGVFGHNCDAPSKPSRPLTTKMGKSPAPALAAPVLDVALVPEAPATSEQGWVQADMAENRPALAPDPPPSTLQDKMLDLVPESPPPVPKPSPLSTRSKTYKRRGLMAPLKQAEVRNLVLANRLSLIGIVETKVPHDLFNVISGKLLNNWCWKANLDYAERGRIWVGWDPSAVSFEAISVSDQVFHGELRWLDFGMTCMISIVYAEHSFTARRPLWEDLVVRSPSLQDVPWLVMGDFNAIKDPSDRLGGSDGWLPSFDEFGHCLDQAELDDLRYVGFRYTWSTSSGSLRKMRKIDKVLVNAC